MVAPPLSWCEPVPSKDFSQYPRTNSGLALFAKDQTTSLNIANERLLKIRTYIETYGTLSTDIVDNPVDNTVDNLE